jgi:hypothetical protein
MKLRPLIMDSAAKAEVARVKAHAESNRYRPDRGDPTPGDNPAYVARLGSYRVVFTMTEQKGELWRHLSVSVPGGKLPNPAAVFMIADAFGFTGWSDKRLLEPGPDWGVGHDAIAHCIVVAQSLGAAVAREKLT